MRIKKIEIYGGLESTLFKNNSEDKLIFSWIDTGKPINMFYFGNGYGKSTLFDLLKKVVTGDRISKKDFLIYSNKEGEHSISRIFLEIQVGKDVVSISRSQNRYRYEINGVLTNDIDEYLENNVFGPFDALKKTIKNKDISSRKTTIKCLGRAFFCGDDTYYKQTSEKTCNLIDNHIDALDEKIIFFYSLLGENLNQYEGNVLDNVMPYKKAKEEKEMLTKKLGSNISENNVEVMLWHQKYKEQNENLKSVEKEMSLCFDNIQEANLAIKKLKQLVKEAREFDGMKRMIELIEDEVINLQKYIEENQNQVKEKESYLKNKERDIIETYQNFADIESMRDKLKKIEVKLEDHKLGLEYLQNEQERKVLLSNFEGIYKPILKYLGYAHCKLDTLLSEKKSGTLKVKLGSTKRDDKVGDGHLRLTRLVFLIALQFYKEKYKDITKLPGLGFYDAPFYGVTHESTKTFMQGIIDYFKKNNSQVQLFFFDTKIPTGTDELDKFFVSNKDYIYQHPLNDSGKMFDI